MRQVIDYYKDFEKGINVVRKRDKKEFVGRGVATIQIFDKNGVLEKEVRSENCICEKWISAMYYQFVKNTFLRSYSNIINTSNLKYMVLSSHNGTEDPQDLKSYGKEIAYVELTDPYSGDDTSRGTINKAESSYSTWGTHIVVDFPTHAGNGTFNSIYMNAKNILGISNYYQYERISLSKLGIENTGSSTCMKVLGLIGDKYAVVIYNARVDDITTGTLALTDFSKPISGGLTGIKCDNGCTFDGKIYILDGKMITVYNSLDFSVLSTFTLSFLSNYPHAFMIDNNILYITESEYITNKYVSYFYKYDLSTMEHEFLGTCENNGYGLLKFGNYIYGNNKNWSFIYELETGKMYEKGESLPGENSTHRGFNLFWDINKNSIIGSYLYSFNSKSFVYRYSLLPYISHTKLPAPVTKTSANTMKIQYDYEIEPKEAFE